MNAEELVSLNDAGERDFREADLHHANLIKAHLLGINLGGANLHLANLSGACLDRAILEEVDFERAWLGGIYVDGELRWADLRQSAGYQDFVSSQHVPWHTTRNENA